MFLSKVTSSTVTAWVKALSRLTQDGYRPIGEKFRPFFPFFYKKEKNFIHRALATIRQGANANELLLGCGFDRHGIH